MPASDYDTAEEFWESLEDPSPEDALEVARAYIAEQDDLPEKVWHGLGAQQPAWLQVGVWEDLLKLRAEHWQKRGEPMPEYKRRWR
jgi:hypothetical protein